MGDIWKIMGRYLGKLANREGLLSGLVSAVDPRVVAKAVNENGELVREIVRHLDPEALAGALNANPDFMAALLKNLDATAVSAAVNRNQRFIDQLIEHTNPNVFTRSLNVLFDKIRKATYRPGIAPVGEREDSG